MQLDNCMIINVICTNCVVPRLLHRYCIGSVTPLIMYFLDTCGRTQNQTNICYLFCNISILNHLYCVTLRVSTFGIEIFLQEFHLLNFSLLLQGFFILSLDEWWRGYQFYFWSQFCNKILKWCSFVLKNALFPKVRSDSLSLSGVLGNLYCESSSTIGGDISHKLYSFMCIATLAYRTVVYFMAYISFFTSSTSFLLYPLLEFNSLHSSFIHHGAKI